MGEDEDVVKEEHNGGGQNKTQKGEQDIERRPQKAKSQTGDVLDLRSRSAEIRNLRVDRKQGICRGRTHRPRHHSIFEGVDCITVTFPATTLTA